LWGTKKKKGASSGREDSWGTEESMNLQIGRRGGSEINVDVALGKKTRISEAASTLKGPPTSPQNVGKK